MRPIAVRNDLLGLLWFDTPSNAPPMAYDQVATAINQAFQILWLSPADYMRRAGGSISTVIGTESYSLSDVQDVLTPMRCDGVPMVGVASKTAFVQGAQRFLGLMSHEGQTGFPRLFYVERLANTALADPVSVSIKLCPVPDAVYTITYDYSRRCPSYSSAGLAADSPELPIPHEYVESLLLPVARYCLTSSHWFEQPDKLPVLAAGFTAALQRAGYADPQIEALRLQYGAATAIETQGKGGDE